MYQIKIGRTSIVPKWVNLKRYIYKDSLSQMCNGMRFICIKIWICKICIVPDVPTPTYDFEIFRIGDQWPLFCLLRGCLYAETAVKDFSIYLVYYRKSHHTRFSHITHKSVYIAPYDNMQ